MNDNLKNLAKKLANPWAIPTCEAADAIIDAIAPDLPEDDRDTVRRALEHWIEDVEREAVYNAMCE